MNTSESELGAGQMFGPGVPIRSLGQQLHAIAGLSARLMAEKVQPGLNRLGLHGAILALVVAAILWNGVNISAAPSPQTPSQFFAMPARSASAAAELRPIWTAGNETLTRYASPVTIIPDRPREAIITYTVRPGDTLFGIALMYNLAPETVLWANSELKDNPDMLNVGMVLNIPPVDGVVHVVQEGDTLEAIAARYKVSVEAIVNASWNSLRNDQQPVVGQHLIVPGGKRELVVWQLPKPTAAVSAAFIKAHAGFCAGVAPGPLGTGAFIWPNDDHRVTGNPYTGWHRAIDLAGRTGDPVYAADSGTVVYAGWNSWGYGNLIVLDHGNGWQTWYAHLSQLYVGCGQQVLQGATIGAIGSTGRSTGPHLHFETRYNGDLPNPLNYLP